MKTSPHPLNEHLCELLKSRQSRSLLRQFPPPSPHLSDFSSNDYLGLSHHPVLLSRLASRIVSPFILNSNTHSITAKDTSFKEKQNNNNNNNNNRNNDKENKSETSQELVSNGSTGSRLLTGNSHLAEKIEVYLKNYHEGESAILFNSGYQANLSLFGSVPMKDDVIIYDELIHASVHEGIKSGRGTGIPFRHNDIKDLERTILQVRKNQKENNRNRFIFVAVESLYSMDGDLCPLVDIVDIVTRYGAYLAVDEVNFCFLL